MFSFGLPRTFWRFFFSIVLGSPISQAQTVWYVNDDAGGANTGTSWTDGFTITNGSGTVSGRGFALAGRPPAVPCAPGENQRGIPLRGLVYDPPAPPTQRPGRQIG